MWFRACVPKGKKPLPKVLAGRLGPFTASPLNTGDYKHKVTTPHGLPYYREVVLMKVQTWEERFCDKFRGAGPMVHLTEVPDSFHLVELSPTFNRCSE